MAWAEVARAKTKATPANLIIVTSICTRLADFLFTPYGDWQLMAVMVGRLHWRCDRHALNWLQQKVEHAA
jgi:hypothetical protein